jgi:hypothetical protein
MNKLLKYIFSLLFVVCAGYQSYAQYYPGPRRRFIPAPPPPPGYTLRVGQGQTAPEFRVLNVKERFIKRQLHLGPDKAQIFFPLYHEYQMELFNVQRLKRMNNSSLQPDVNKNIYYETQILNIKQRFNDAFLKVLPPEKVGELYKAEREFNDELVRSLSERNAPPN